MSVGRQSRELTFRHERHMLTCLVALLRFLKTDMQRHIVLFQQRSTFHSQILSVSATHDAQPVQPFCGASPGRVKFATWHTLLSNTLPQTSSRPYMTNYS